MGAGAPLWPLRRLEHEGMGAQHLQIYTLWAPKGTFSTEKTVNQALQHLAKKRHRKGTAWPATGATGRCMAGLGEAESSGWEGWVRPLEDAAGALLCPCGLRAQDGPDRLIKDSFQASLGEGRALQVFH